MGVHMTVYTEEYKGFCIVVTENKQAHHTARYMAKASNGSDSACGESIETAVCHLKQKIDNIDAFQEFYTRPLEADELQRLVAFLRSPNGEMRLRHKLQRRGFFTQDDFVEIGIRAIINHTDLIQIELNSQGNSFQLARIGVTTGRSDYYAIYDSKRFDTTEKRLQLKDKLIELGFDE